VLVIVLESLGLKIDHEQEHDHDYETGEQTTR
jgi:hypothetical protein